MNIITDFLNFDENDVKCCSSYIENDTLIISVTGYHSDTVEYYLLKNFKWLLLVNEVKENKPRYNKRLKRWINYPQLLELILSISPELRETYRFKDRYCILNTFSDYEHCEADLKIFADEMKNIKSEEMKIVLKMIRN